MSDWIPTSKQLPNKNGKYLVTCRLSTGDYYVHVLFYFTDLTKVDKAFKEHRGGWCEEDVEFGWYEVSRVTAWMPKPEPYKGEEE